MDKKAFFKFCFGTSSETFPQKAVISPFISEKNIEEKYETIKKFRGKLFSGVLFKHNNEEVVYIKTGIGSAFSGDAVLLLGETAIKNIIFVGTCGGLGEGSFGDLVICERAFDGEGFSRYLTHDVGEMLEKNKFVSCDNLFLDTFESYIISASGIGKGQRGDIYTIGSLLAETKNNLVAIEKKGFIGIDMEASAIYNAASKINKKILAVLVISDLPLEKNICKVEGSFEKKEIIKRVNEVLHLGIDFLSRG